jgi:large subunit ribosomal protein L3
MAGHMGAKKITTQNLEIVSADEDTGVILVKGAVPGAKGGWVTISDAMKKPINENIPLPAAIRLNQENASLSQGGQASEDPSLSGSKNLEEVNARGENPNED